MGERRRAFAVVILFAAATVGGVLLGRHREAAPPAKLHVDVALATVEPERTHDAGDDANGDDHEEGDEDDEDDAGIALAALPPPELKVRLPKARAARRGAPPPEEKTRAAEPIPEAPPEPTVIDAGAPQVVVDAGGREEERGFTPPPAEPLPLVVTFEDDLSAIVRLVQVDVYVDGRRAKRLADRAGLAIDGPTLLEAPLPPGVHQVRLELVYTGKPGLFAYMESYTFRLRDMRVVELDDKPRTYRVTAFDRDPTMEFEKRLALKSVVE